MPPTIKRLRWIGIAVLIAAYAVLAHHANTSQQPGRFGAFLALGPLFLLMLATAANAATRTVGATLLVAGTLASWHWWNQAVRHAGFLFWLQDIGLMLTLLLAFARTLLPGRKPLCVQFAEILHGSPLDAAHERYARQVTVAWGVFFGTMAAVSALLFFLAPLAVWSVFANFLVLPLIALMFGAEFLVRRQVLSAQASGHVLDALRAYLESQHG